jgi:hypothetical protein
MAVFRSRLRLRRIAPRVLGAPPRRGGGAEVVMPSGTQEPAGAIALIGSPPAPLGHEPYGMK